MKEVDFMREAIRLAQDGITSKKGGPFGCIVVKDGEIIGRGQNEVTSKNDPSARAEVVAIRDACKKLDAFQLEGCDVYASSEPCPMCLGALYWARPSQIFFGCSKEDAADIGFDDDFIYKEIKTSVIDRKIPTRQMLHNEALEPFKAWNEMEDKIEY